MLFQAENVLTPRSIVDLPETRGINKIRQYRRLVDLAKAERGYKPLEADPAAVLELTDGGTPITVSADFDHEFQQVDERQYDMSDEAQAHELDAAADLRGREAQQDHVPIEPERDDDDPETRHRETRPPRDEPRPTSYRPQDRLPLDLHF